MHAAHRPHNEAIIAGCWGDKLIPRVLSLVCWEFITTWEFTEYQRFGILGQANWFTHYGDRIDLPNVYAKNLAPKCWGCAIRRSESLSGNVILPLAQNRDPSFGVARLQRHSNNGATHLVSSFAP